jgi:hypothetical protein
MPTMTSEAVAVDILGRILCEVWAEAEETVEHNRQMTAPRQIRQIFSIQKVSGLNRTRRRGVARE